MKKCNLGRVSLALGLPPTPIMSFNPTVTLPRSLEQLITAVTKEEQELLADLIRPLDQFAFDHASWQALMAAQAQAESASVHGKLTELLTARKNLDAALDGLTLRRPASHWQRLSLLGKIVIPRDCEEDGTPKAAKVRFSRQKITFEYAQKGVRSQSAPTEPGRYKVYVVIDGKREFRKPGFAFTIHSNVTTTAMEPAATAFRENLLPAILPRGHASLLPAVLEAAPAQRYLYQKSLAE